jgi:hypothetical protein
MNVLDYSRVIPITTWLTGLHLVEQINFGSDYDEIEEVLAEKLDEETFLIVNDAISEAVSNVLNHAYETHQRSLGWKVSLRVTEEYLSLAITDLGKSIPVTVPDRIDDHILNRLSNIFNTTNLLGMDDAQLIDIASEFRRSITEEKTPRQRLW